MGNTYLAGSLVVVTVTFTDPLTNAGVDPGQVTLRWAQPGGATQSWIYTQAPQIARSGPGAYQASIDTTGGATGFWIYEWLGTTPGQAVTPGSFKVVPAPL